MFSTITCMYGCNLRASGARRSEHDDVHGVVSFVPNSTQRSSYCITKPSFPCLGRNATSLPSPVAVLDGAGVAGASAPSVACAYVVVAVYIVSRFGQPCRNASGTRRSCLGALPSWRMCVRAVFAACWRVLTSPLGRARLTTAGTGHARSVSCLANYGSSWPWCRWRPGVRVWRCG